MKAFLSHRLVWPAAVLLALLVANQVANHSFLSITVQDGNLFGPLIDILRRAAPVVLVALGMTLVIATRGIDLSVGAVAAISGSWASMYIIGSADRASVGVVLTAIGVALLMALVAGMWNGFLVSVLGIQPIVATLVLMTAGRGLAQVITDEKILYPDNSPAYKLIGGGYLLAVPFSILLAGAIFALTAVLTRKTALGTLIESVGVNPEASRLAGVRARTIIFIVYVFSGLCAGLAGLMLTSNSTSADPNSIGLFIELDAILAVVIGGTSLAGGRFSLAGTLIGAFIIETMDTFVVIAISARSTDVFKACVVIVVCLLQSPQARSWLVHTVLRRPVRRPAPPPPPPAAVDAPVAVPDAGTLIADAAATGDDPSAPTGSAVTGNAATESSVTGSAATAADSMDPAATGSGRSTAGAPRSDEYTVRTR
ncbi:ABC transporter permease [Nakamurella sp. YIM 132087]|uniref:ABC transporter permease n=1 Tax=Nakamurella alba TaxID=2665158 RepID=A0A7K1FIR1_9ACTN|nr:ABC transporter permease [Nakamurella alba]MTD14002.1 ABC transporter permease [Nakamurella alba]